VGGQQNGLAFRQEGSGEPLLLINGYAAGKYDWDPTFVQALASSSTVICPDNRGIGDSPPFSADHTVGAMADDVLALMDGLGTELMDVAGWSMGGFIAQELAARAPERVRRLVLLATDIGGPDAVPAATENWAALIDHGGSPREQASRVIALLFPPQTAAAVDEQFGDLVAEARATLSPSTLHAQEQAIDAWHSEPAAERVRRIATPALVAAGTEDVVIPFVNSELLAAALPGSRREGLDGCGHAFMAQQPLGAAEMINAWLGRATPQ
jgi:pimeloyl-ACP methyl ester carboxylesterase